MIAAAPHSIELPPPGEAALAASRVLYSRIAAEIQAVGGWLSFARYMERTLYEPDLGYYAGGAVKLGSAGDFVTAPELGELFGRTLARQVAELLQPGDAVLEFGAGSGALAAAVLDELGHLGHGATPYFIVETSAGLAARQRARLAAPVQWLSALPSQFRGVVIANEVLDAMPAHALSWTAEGIFERGVGLDDGRFTWRQRPAAGPVLDAARSLQERLHIDATAQNAYESEIGLAGLAWIDRMAAMLDRGTLLVIDYGFPRSEYYHPQRSMGTLMCHYRHHAHDDPFFLPGLQDITTHVDFSAIADRAADAGLEILGYANQASFLLDCGITELLSGTDPADVRRYAPLAAQANLLLSPAEMGELFKVLAVGRGVDGSLRGFSRGDRTHTL